MALYELQKNFRSPKIYWFERDTKEISVWKVGDRTRPFYIHRGSIGLVDWFDVKQRWA